MTKFDGQRIKKRREILGLTQEALAEAVGTSQKNISDYERNIQTNIQSLMLTKLAESLEVSVGYFFEDSEGLDGLESAAIQEFRALPSDEVKQFAIKFLHDLQQFTNKLK